MTQNIRVYLTVSYNLVLFHLVNHAFYKGLLFLGAGAVIHVVADNQDFRKYGGSVKKIFFIILMILPSMFLIYIILYYIIFIIFE